MPGYCYAGSGMDVEDILVHPGRLFFRHKDRGAWTNPKGLPGEGELLPSAALKEFGEETGSIPEGTLRDLGTVRYAGGKIVHAWACAGDLPNGLLGPANNTFRLEWPPRSAKFEELPEVDQGDFYIADAGKDKVNPAQAVFIERLTTLLVDAGRTVVHAPEQNLIQADYPFFCNLTVGLSEKQKRHAVACLRVGEDSCPVGQCTHLNLLPTGNKFPDQVTLQYSMTDGGYAMISLFATDNPAHPPAILPP